MDSLFSKVRKSDLRREPFPHIVIHDAVPEELCARLLSEYPSLPVITRGKSYASNERFNLVAADIMREERVSMLWKEFVTVHLTSAFWTEVTNVFEQDIRKTAPWLATEGNDLRTIRIGVRGVDSDKDTDLLLDANIAVNTPIEGKPSSVKIAHLDNPKELFAGLWYLRSPHDDSRGGDLEIYRYKGTKMIFHGPRLVDKRYVEKVGTIPYKNNTFIFFLNSLHALHGVTPRQVTPHLRYLFNIVGIAHKPLFNLEPYRENFFRKLQRHLL